MCISVGAVAQKPRKHKRQEFTLESVQVKNDSGEITAVRIDVFLKGKRVQEFTYRLPDIPNQAQAPAIGKFTETDLNFDGVADVDIYLGYWGANANDVCYGAMLWDKKHYCFIMAEGYAELAGPMVDKKKKCIYTNLRNGTNQRIIDYYKWEGNKLKHSGSEVLDIE